MTPPEARSQTAVGVKNGVTLVARLMARAKTSRVKTQNGAGSVILRSDGRWMARYSTTDPENGPAARKTLYGRTEQEAPKLVLAT